MSVCLFIYSYIMSFDCYLCIFIYLWQLFFSISGNLFFSMYIHLSICLYIYLSIPVCLYIDLLICILSVSLSMYVCIPIHLFSFLLLGTSSRVWTKTSQFVPVHTLHLRILQCFTCTTFHHSHTLIYLSLPTHYFTDTYSPFHKKKIGLENYKTN